VTFSAIVSKNHNTYGTLPLVKLAGTLSFASASWNLAGAFARATDASYFELSLVPEFDLGMVNPGLNN